MAISAPRKQIRVGVRELRAKLTELLGEARRGTSVLVTSRNVVVAEIGPPPRVPSLRRKPGLLKGKIRIADDFDVLPQELLDAMQGEM